MLEQKIKEDYFQALKNKDKIRSSTLNFLRAQFKNHIINNKLDQLDDKDAISIIKKQIKQRQDSIEQFSAGQRQDLVEKETAELNILKEYMPEELSEDEMKKIITEVVKETNAQSMKDMGHVMKAALEKMAGRADNKVVSQIVKSALSDL